MSAVNEVIGEVALFVTVIYPGMVVVLLPAVFETPSETAYVPIESKVCTGFWLVETPPSPNVQYHPVGVFIDVSVNWTVRGFAPEVTFAVNDDTGTAASTVMYPVWETVLLPAVLVAVRVTV
jgi:hypothetical protein